MSGVALASAVWIDAGKIFKDPGGRTTGDIGMAARPMAEVVRAGLPATEFLTPALPF